MRYLAVIVSFFAFLVAAQPALARDHHDHGNGWSGARSEHNQGRHWGRDDRPSLDRFLPNIRRQHPGRLLDVQRGWGPRGDRNRIKWLTPDGRVIWLDTDARTGEIYGVEGDEPRERWR